MRYSAAHGDNPVTEYRQANLKVFYAAYPYLYSNAIHRLHQIEDEVEQTSREVDAGLSYQLTKVHWYLRMHYLISGMQERIISVKDRRG